MEQNENSTNKNNVGEEIGKEIGKEIGGEIGKHFDEKREKDKKEKKKDKKKSPAMRRVGYIFAIAFAVLFLWAVNNFTNWGWNFILPDWEEVVGVVELSIYLNIIVYGLFLLYDQKLFYHFGRLAMDVVGIYVSVRLYQVFPFDFDHLFGGWSWLNDVFPWLLILGIVGISIGIIVRTGKLLMGKNIYDS